MDRNHKGRSRELYAKVVLEDQHLLKHPVLVRLLVVAAFFFFWDVFGLVGLACSSFMSASVSAFT